MNDIFGPDPLAAFPVACKISVPVRDKNGAPLQKSWVTTKAVWERIGSPEYIMEVE